MLEMKIQSKCCRNTTLVLFELDTVIIFMTITHDGDTTSNIVMFTEESLAEVEKYNREKRAYVGPDGNLRYPVEYDTISFVCYNLCVFEEEPGQNT